MNHYIYKKLVLKEIQIILNEVQNGDSDACLSLNISQILFQI